MTSRAEALEVLAAPVAELLTKVHAASLDAHVCVGEVGLTGLALRMSTELPDSFVTLSNELRGRAAQILDGSAPARLPHTPTLEVVRQVEKVIRVFALRNLKWLNAEGRTVAVGKWHDADLPISIAEAAEARKLVDDPDGSFAKEWRPRRSDSPPSVTDCMWIIEPTGPSEPKAIPSGIFTEINRGAPFNVKTPAPAALEPMPARAQRDAGDADGET